MDMIGRMRGQLTFQEPSSVSVGGGGVETVYSDLLTTYCEAKPLRSSRELSEHQTVLKNGYQFKVRCREGFEPSKDMLILYKEGTYTISSIENVDERGRFWKITGTEKV